MNKKTLVKNLIFIGLIIAYIVFCFAQTPITQAVVVTGEGEEAVAMGSLWSLLPPIIAIGLALITKEVYSSLFIGIISGAVIHAVSMGTGFVGIINVVVKDGIISNIADVDLKNNDYGHVGILVFLVVLGAIVVLMNRAGGSRAYGEWASKHIKSKAGASIATFLLGVLIFVDDYFNCLTVGSVMRPVTDKHKISRSKLAYIIDATAAPVCIIAPISSWAAAVSGTVEGVNGIQLFISTIPYNLYAILTLIMVIFISFSNSDYGPMRTHEINAMNGDLFTTRNSVYDKDEEPGHSRGKVIDLILPVILLIGFCVLGMLYTGGIFEGENIIDAFANCYASTGLAIGSLGALIVIIFYYLIRRVLKFTECMESLVLGFKQMVPAILILIFAWTLNAVTKDLGAAEFVKVIVENAHAVQLLLPLLLFAVALGLSFATGTSWGTFGILIPIVTGVFSSQLAGVTDGNIPSMVIICISACLAGAVCGDHCSPISDTTIMASTGAQCDHVNHVSTQLPYALTVAGVAAVGYLISGFVQNVFVVLGISIALMFAVLFAIRLIAGKDSVKKS